MTLCAVDENRDGKEIVADRQLAAGENRPARNAKLVRTSLAGMKLGKVGTLGLR
jgi:hypothetical protein